MPKLVLFYLIKSEIIKSWIDHWHSKGSEKVCEGMQE